MLSMWLIQTNLNLMQNKNKQTKKPNIDVKPFNKPDLNT